LKMEKNMLMFAITTTTRLAGLSLYEKDKLLGEMHGGNGKNTLYYDFGAD